MEIKITSRFIDQLVQASVQMARIGFLALTSMSSIQCSSWPAQLFDIVLGKNKLCAFVQTQTAQRLLQAGFSWNNIYKDHGKKLKKCLNQ